MRNLYSANIQKNKKKIASKNCKASCYIIGPMRLQNELMAAYLKEKTGNECSAVDDIHQIPEDDPNDRNRQKLLFLDCQGKNPKALLAELGPFIKNKRLKNRIVFFNVPTDVEFQKHSYQRESTVFFTNVMPLITF